MTRHRVVYIHSDNLIDAADRLPANIGRASLVHELIAGLDLLSANANDSDPDTAPIIAPIPATREDLLSFHEARYVGEHSATRLVATDLTRISCRRYPR